VETASRNGGPGGPIINLRQLNQVAVEEILAIRGRAGARRAAVGRGRAGPPAVAGRRSASRPGPEMCTSSPATFEAQPGTLCGLYLNSRNQVLRREIISIGSLNASIVHPREVYQPAIAVSAASLILAHNHPSGDPTPSDEDLAITRRLVEAGRILGIEVLDHVVVAKDAYASFKERKLLHA
jgi:DNA repair protein RadC